MELRLIVEVSDSTYLYDSRVKAALYARPRIPEYWILDVRDEGGPCLLVHAEPVDGVYRAVNAYNAAEKVIVLDGRELFLNAL